MQQRMLAATVAFCLVIVVGGRAEAAWVFQKYDCENANAVARNVATECLTLPFRFLAALMPVDQVTSSDSLLAAPKVWLDPQFVGLGLTALGAYLQSGINPVDVFNSLGRCFCMELAQSTDGRADVGNTPRATGKVRMD